MTVLEDESGAPILAGRSRPARALPTAELVRRVDFTEDHMVVWFTPEVPFTFKPGQYCTLGLQGIERPYSIVSAPHEPSLEIFVELIPPPEGLLTPLIWQLKVGDRMTVRPSAKGLFTFDPQYQNHLMVSTVTGIAPFISILRDHLHRGAGGHRFYILQGASYRQEFLYDTELLRFQQEHSDVIAFVPTVSRPQDERNQDWTGETGRVNLLVEKYVDLFELNPDDTLVYGCGHPDMILDVKRRLTPYGFRVKEERFWK